MSNAGYSYPLKPYPISLTGRTYKCKRCGEERLKCLFGLKTNSKKRVHGDICHFCIKEIDNMVDKKEEQEDERRMWMHSLSTQRPCQYDAEKRDKFYHIKDLPDSPEECLYCGGWRGNERKFNLVMDECHLYEGSTLISAKCPPPEHGYRWCNLCVDCMEILMRKMKGDDSHDDLDFHPNVIPFFNQVESGLDTYQPGIYCSPSMTGFIRNHFLRYIIDFTLRGLLGSEE